MIKKMIINAEDMIVGRLSTYVAKRALLGEEIHIVNSEKARITGKPEEVINKFKKRQNLGAPLIGPYFPKVPERVLKRMIRGMLPYKKSRGREAYARIKCYVGVPEEFKSQNIIELEQFHINTKGNVRSISIGQISKQLGAKL